MQIEGKKLIFIMNFSVLDFFKFASRMPEIAQVFPLVFLELFQALLSDSPQTMHTPHLRPAWCVWHGVV